MVKLTFLGAANCVTGSKFLLEASGYKLLIDCGLFQGAKSLRLKNWEDFPFAASSINAVVLTHAHIDHSGSIPLLVNRGFSGKIHCSEATKDLCKILLPDSARLQEEDARYANKKGFSKHSPALPLYNEIMAFESLKQFKKHPFQEDFQLGPFTCQLIPAGHILGAASVLIKWDDKSILFSGDLGREEDLMMPPPQAHPTGIDWIVMESTYGGRIHPHIDPLEAFQQIINKTYSRMGKVLIPAFALGRAQTLLYCLYQLKLRNKLPPVPIYLNSPMAIDITRLLTDYMGQHRWSKETCQGISKMVKFVHSVQESKAINQSPEPMIVISASGMLTGGRVLHHLREWGKDSRNTILLVGHQVEGTRGYQLISGQKNIKVHGQIMTVEAEVAHFDFFSAHADQEGLLNWVGSEKPLPKQIFLVHGEPESAAALKIRIKEKLGISSRVVDLGETVEL